MNRYFTEAVLIYRIYVTSHLAQPTKQRIWLSYISAIIAANTSQSYIMMRAYRLWDHRRSVRRTLLIVFGISGAAVTILSTLSVLSYLNTGAESQILCNIQRIPRMVNFKN